MSIRYLCIGIMGAWLSFSGVTWAAETLPDPNDAEGNWYVEWHDYPGIGGVTRTALYLHKQWNVQIDPADSGGNRYRMVRDDDSAWALRGGWGFMYSGDPGDITQEANGTFVIQHLIPSPLGYAESRVRLVSPDQMEGTWSFDDREGRQIWTRAKPSISRIRFISEIESEEIESEVAPGQTGHVKEVWNDRWPIFNGNVPDRPTFEIEVYGENLWGHHVTYLGEAVDLEGTRFQGWISKEGVKNFHIPGYAPDDTAGMYLTGIIWENATPGLKELVFDGQRYPFELEIEGFPGAQRDEVTRVPEGETTEPIDQVPVTASPTVQEGATDFILSLVTTDGSRTLAGDAPIELDGSSPFRLELTYPAPSEQVPSEAMVRWPDDTFSVALKADEASGALVSSWYVLSSHSMRDFKAIRGWVDPNYSRDAEQIGRELAGEWSVAWQDLDRLQPLEEIGDGYGLAVISNEGDTIHLSIKDGDEEFHYSAFEISATLSGGVGDINFLRARFEESNDLISARPVDGEDSSEPITSIYLPDGTQTATAEIGDQQIDIRISSLSKPKRRLRVQLKRMADGRLTGYWKFEDPNGEFGDSGQQTWFKQASIEGVVVLGEQHDSRRLRTRGDRSFDYPFGEGGDPFGQQRRTLFVYGRNLPTHRSAAYVFRSEDDKIDYRLSSIFADPIEAGSEVWEKAGVGEDDREGLTALTITAILSDGVLPGIKEFTLNGLPAQWRLEFADSIGKLYFSHRWRESEFGPTDIFYMGDDGQIVIDEVAAIPLDGIELVFTKNDEPIGDGQIFAHREVGQGQVHYLSPPIRLVSSEDPTIAPPDDSNAITVEVSAGDYLQAKPVDPLLIRLLPTVVTIVAEPGDPVRPEELARPTWRQALERVAACYDEEHLNFSSMPHEVADEYSKFILTENLEILISPLFWPFAESRSIQITKGDHAASLLIRDEFVRLMEDDAIPSLERVLTSEENIRQFYENGQQKESAIWSAMRGVLPVSSTDVPLRELLNARAQAEYWQMTPDEAERYAHDQTRIGLTDVVTKARNAVSRAIGAGDCNLDELLVLAGQDADAVVARIMPRLVKQATDGQRVFWEPDFLAQGYVGGLKNIGRALRTLDAYGQVDDVYKSLSVAAATAGIAAVMEFGAGATSAVGWALLAGDGLDAAYFGTRGVIDYVEGNQRVEYAEGASPVMGDAFLTEAHLRSSEWYEAALGVILPTGGAALSFRELRQAGRVARGAAIAETIDDFDAARISALTDSERVELASYYTDLNARRLERPIEALSDAERADLEKFDRFFRGDDVPLPGQSRSAELVQADEYATWRGTGSRPSTSPDGDIDQLSRWEETTLGGPASPGITQPRHATFSTQDGEELSLPFGPKIGQGRTTSAYAHGDDPDNLVIRVTNGTERMDVELDEFGRTRLEELQDGSDGLFRVTERKGRWVVDNPNDATRNNVIIEVAERTEGTAAARITEQGGEMTPGQLYVYDQTVRYLNRNGIAWTDNHFKNFDLLPIDEENDVWQVVILDTGGFFPASGTTAGARYQNARAVQEAFNLPDEEWVRAWNAAQGMSDSPERTEAIRILRTSRQRQITRATDGRLEYGDVYSDPDDYVWVGAPSHTTRWEDYRDLASRSPVEADALYETYYNRRPPLLPPAEDVTAPPGVQ